MKTILLTYYDDRRRDIAQVAVPAMKRFAEKNQIELVALEEPTLASPMGHKILLVLKFLEQCDRLIYADSDVLFQRHATLRDLFQKPVGVSQDYAGLCTGFMTFVRAVKVVELVTQWKIQGALPIPGRPFPSDQRSFQKLVARLSDGKELVEELSQDVVSNPLSSKIGSLAHHYWAQHASQVLDRMRRSLR